VENARFYVSRDTLDLLTSTDLRVQPIRIICISSVRERHYQQNEWSFIDVGLKLWKLWSIIFPLPHYFDAFLSMWRFHKNACTELVIPHFFSTTGLEMYQVFPQLFHVSKLFGRPYYRSRLWHTVSSVCLSVCLWRFVFRQNGWTDLHEIFREGVDWPWDDLITFWVNSEKPRDAAILISLSSTLPENGWTDLHECTTSFA